MRKQIQPFLLLVLVVVSLPALQCYRRTLEGTSPAPSPYIIPAPSSSPTPSPTSPPTPTWPPPAPTPTSPPSPPQLPPPSGGVPQDGGGGSSGLSGGQKAGIVIGVLAGAGLIGFATMVYMKRRSNIQRARFGVLARRSQL